MCIDYSQEHNLLFVCAMDDGEIWTLSNHEIRFCKNISMDRKSINYGETTIKDTKWFGYDNPSSIPTICFITMYAHRSSMDNYNDT